MKIHPIARCVAPTPPALSALLPLPAGRGQSWRYQVGSRARFFSGVFLCFAKRFATGTSKRPPRVRPECPLQHVPKISTIRWCDTVAGITILPGYSPERPGVPPPTYLFSPIPAQPSQKGKPYPCWPGAWSKPHLSPNVHIPILPSIENILYRCSQ